MTMLIHDGYISMTVWTLPLIEVAYSILSGSNFQRKRISLLEPILHWEDIFNDFTLIWVNIFRLPIHNFETSYRLFQPMWRFWLVSIWFSWFIILTAGWSGKIWCQLISNSVSDYIYPTLKTVGRNNVLFTG